MVAGRSGSAFAAQIGSMRLGEEIDAMRTIGVSPMEALVLPRMLAATILMPVLGFYSSLIAIFGGGIFCWRSEEHTSELQSLMRISYAVFCLHKNNNNRS